jgi:hypothetical protein
LGCPDGETEQKRSVAEEKVVRIDGRNKGKSDKRLP